MVGAKQYEIGHRTFQEKEENPIIKNMKMPKFNRIEQTLEKFPKLLAPHHTLLHPKPSLLDRFKTTKIEASQMKQDPTMRKKPKTAITTLPKGEKMADMFEKNNDHSFESLFEHFPFLNSVISQDQDKSEEQEEDNHNKISEEAMNHITYKVFQNIKKYLDNDSIRPETGFSGNKRIRLEIDL